MLQGRVTVPLYAGGQISARARQARQTALQQRQLIENQRVNARAATIAAWSSLTSARAQLISDGEQVRASRTALTGVREEERVGQRTLLDVLDAEQELLDAQVSLAVTQRNLIVAAYAVLDAIGRLDVSTLQLAVTPYDPEEYNKLVETKKYGVTLERDASNDADVEIVGGLPAFEVTLEPALDGWETTVEANVERPRNETAIGTGPTNDVFGIDR
ncbi:MAG: TolC family protein [Pseudomonadota bacterium]